MEVTRLGLEDLTRIGSIDRSEHVDVQYHMVDGEIVERPVVMVDVPNWDPAGSGPESVAWHIEFCRPLVERGAAFLGVLDGDSTCGLAVVDPTFEPGLAWFAWLHVSRPYRRRGVARALWGTSIEVAREGGAPLMYVSANPTGAAVGFYLRQGCRLADPVHPTLFAHEPEDIHFVCSTAAHA